MFVSHIVCNIDVVMQLMMLHYTYIHFQMTLHGTGSMRSSTGRIVVPEILKSTTQPQPTAECFLIVLQVYATHEELLLIQPLGKLVCCDDLIIIV